MEGELFAWTKYPLSLLNIHKLRSLQSNQPNQTPTAHPKRYAAAMVGLEPRLNPQPPVLLACLKNSGLKGKKNWC